MRVIRNYYRLLDVIRYVADCNVFQQHTHYTVSQKTSPLRQVGINSVIFQIQKKSEI